MIDRDSGTLFFDDGTEVDPRIARPKFLTSPLELPTTPDAQSAPPWSIYTLAPRMLDGHKFASRLSFNGDVLELLAIWNVEVEEAARLERHDVWIQLQFGDGSLVFPWGKVDSLTEPNGGGSIILFSYI
jgi:hypothetical protein